MSLPSEVLTTRGNTNSRHAPRPGEILRVVLTGAGEVIRRAAQERALWPTLAADEQNRKRPRS